MSDFPLLILQNVKIFYLAKSESDSKILTIFTIFCSYFLMIWKNDFFISENVLFYQGICRNWVVTLTLIISIVTLMIDQYLS